MHQQRFLRLLTGLSGPERRSARLRSYQGRSGGGSVAVERQRTCGCASTLPALFAAQAQRTPDAVAVVYEERRLSYAALEAHSNQLAHHLRGLGVGPETVVGLCVERSVEMVIGLLGILKAGGAYLPLDPGYPAERLSFMLADAGVAVLVSQSGLLERLGERLGELPALMRRGGRWCGRWRGSSCGWTPTGPRSRGSRRARRRSRSIPATRPMSSHLRLNRNPQGRRRRACKPRQ